MCLHGQEDRGKVQEDHQVLELVQMTLVQRR